MNKSSKMLLGFLCEDMTDEEIRARCRDKKEEIGFHIEKALFPHNPFDDEPIKALTIEQALWTLKDWKPFFKSVERNNIRFVMSSVSDSVDSSYYDAVNHSLRQKVLYTVSDSIFKNFTNIDEKLGLGCILESVHAVVEAYISSIFYKVEKWEGVEHEKGVNPFQSAIDLWESGYVPTYDGCTWELHTKDGIVWEESK